MASNIGAMVSRFTVRMCFFPIRWLVRMLHSIRGLMLWLIMLCSFPRASASSVTLSGLLMSCSMAARRVGLARFVNMRWQSFVGAFFVVLHLLVIV